MQASGLLTGGIYEVYGIEYLIQFVRVGKKDMYIKYGANKEDVGMSIQSYRYLFYDLNCSNTKRLMQPSRPALQRLHLALKDQITRQQSEYIRTGIRPEFKACDSIYKDDDEEQRKTYIRNRNQLLKQVCSENGQKSFYGQSGSMYSVGDRQYIMTVSNSYAYYIPIQECISSSYVSGLQDCKITLFDNYDNRGEQRYHLKCNSDIWGYFTYFLIKG